MSGKRDLLLARLQRGTRLGDPVDREVTLQLQCRLVEHREHLTLLDAITDLDPEFGDRPSDPHRHGAGAHRDQAPDHRHGVGQQALGDGVDADDGSGALLGERGRYAIQKDDETQEKGRRGVSVKAVQDEGPWGGQMNMDGSCSVQRSRAQADGSI